MTAIVMDGRIVAQKVKERVKEKVRVLKEKGVTPTLATILVGEDTASKTYIGAKHRSCDEVGIISQDHRLPGGVGFTELAELIDKLNMRRDVHGILVQLPLPPAIDSFQVVERISPEKDVDGLHTVNIGRAFYKKGVLLPCTPRGVMVLMGHYGVEAAGRYAVIVNRSILVGKPLSLLLTNADATVTLCHSKTKDLEKRMREADILVSAVGRRPSFIVTADMVKDDAVVIDIGMNRVEGKLCGDVEFEAVSKKASYITPVPGGVGPMTVAMLLENTLIATSLQTGIPLEG